MNQCNHIFKKALTKRYNTTTLQVYGGLKDQDRIFTNLYGEQVITGLFINIDFPFNGI